MNLTVTKSSAIKAYRKADSKGKELLSNLYGEETFKNQNIIDRIKTFEDAIEETGRPDVPDFSFLPSDLRKHFIAEYKMIVIAEALNEEWTPNWDDSSEWKYYPWFNMSPCSFAFSCSRYDYSLANAGSGSRLKFKTSELAKYAGEQFADIWKDIQLG